MLPRLSRTAFALATAFVSCFIVAVITRVRFISRSALSLALILTLLVVQTPAAPLVITATASQWRAGLAFWWQASGWSDAVLNFLSAQQGGRPSHQPQERQEDRDARIAQLQISPGDVTVTVGDRIVFAGVAYDASGAPVGGVRLRWRAEREASDEAGGETRNAPRGVPISPRGEFEARSPGRYRITVEATGRRAGTILTVTGDVEDARRMERVRRGEEQPTSVRSVSTRQAPPPSPSSTGPT